MPPRPFLVIACVVVTTPAVAQSRLARPVVDTVNGHIIRVMNPGPTAWTDTNGWKLVYERTVQPAEGSPGMLEHPQQILLVPDGRVIAVQRNPVLISEYDPHGRFIRTIGREGEGPGEFRAPKVALYHDTLVIHDARLGRAAVMTLDGRFVRQFLTNIHSDGPPISVDDRGRLRVTGIRPRVADFQAQWINFDLTGRRLDSLLPPVAVEPRDWQVKYPTGGEMSQSVPFAPYTMYAFLADGRIVYGGTDRYQLLQSRGGADTARIFGRNNVNPRSIPSELRDSMFRLATLNPDLRGIASESDVPRRFAIWGGLSVDGDGNIWIAPGPPEQPDQRFDVFDSFGRYLGAVAAPFLGLWRTSWTADHVAILDTDSNDLPRVRIFRIDRHGH